MAAETYTTIQGTLERITYVNEENQYVVGRLQGGVGPGHD